ncbi:MAG: hypothetical protein AB1411_09715 [Nitrospirota bacterium]
MAADDIKADRPGLCLMAMLLWLSACATSEPGPPADYLRTPQGFAEWQQRETVLRGDAQTAQKRYGRENSLDMLQGYENAVRAYLDHGFGLYRAYRSARMDPPEDLIPSLAQRTAWLLDVADEYVKQGSPAIAEGLADEVVLKYSDLPEMTPAQRRAEALLLRYRYRSDY